MAQVEAFWEWARARVGEQDADAAVPF